VQFLPYLLARLPSVIQDDLFNAETSRAKSEGLTGPKSLACCNDSPDPCVTIRNHETYANCLSKPALTDLKAIHASQSTFDLWYSIKDSSRVDPIDLDVLTNLSYSRIVVYWHTIEWHGKLKIKNMRFAQMFFPRELDELFNVRREANVRFVQPPFFYYSLEWQSISTFSVLVPPAGEACSRGYLVLLKAKKVYR